MPRIEININGSVRKPKPVIYGFLSYDPVVFIREWCFSCTKSRPHEVLDGSKLCVLCCAKTDPEDEQPRFQIEKFIKEEENGA